MRISDSSAKKEGAGPIAELDGTLIVERQMPHLHLSESRFPAERAACRHVHDRPRLMAILGGTVCEKAVGAGHVGGEGSVAIKPAGIWHADNFGREGLHTLTLEFAPGLNQEGVDVFDCFGSYRWSEGGALFAHLHRLSSELRIWGSDSQVIVEGIAAELLDDLGNVRVERYSGPPRWLSTVEDYLRANFQRAICMRDIAAEVGVHHAHVHRTFRSWHGCAIGLFVRRLRVQRAACALRASDEAIANIALDCGFADQPHLTRVFRAWVGVPPGSFRAARD